MKRLFWKCSVRIPGLAEVAVDVACPGERTRITPVKDVVQPRCKLEGPGEVFPGFIGDVETVGSGKTLVLDGAAVVTQDRSWAFRRVLWTCPVRALPTRPFPRHSTWCWSSPPWRVWRNTITAERLSHGGIPGRPLSCLGVKTARADVVESYELPPFSVAMTSHAGLPKVAYLYMLQSQGLLHDTYVYGVDGNLFPR